MQPRDDADYRISLVEQSIVAARDIFGMQHYPTCVDHCQQAVENAAKAVLAVFGPHPPTHGPGALLEGYARRGHFPPAMLPAVQRLAELSKEYGPDVHMRVRYGDETNRILPSRLFDEGSARGALAAAEEALGLAKELLAALP